MRLVRGTIAILTGAAALVVAAPSFAAAQDCDPGVYGCPTTTAPPITGGAGTTIELDIRSGPPGTTVRARACGFVEASTVTITFAGQEVGAASAAADGCASVTFTVPNVAVGTHPVCAAAAGRPSACTSFDVVAGARGDVEVLAGGRQRGSGGGSLARTGITVGALVLVAVGLIATGRYLVARRDRGRQIAAR